MPPEQQVHVTRFGPGVGPEDTPWRGQSPLSKPEPFQFMPGDFILTHSDSFQGKLIIFGQKLRYHGADRKYTWWNHAALIVSTDGDLIEAVGEGIIRTPISHYRPTEYHLVQLRPVVANRSDRVQAVAFAEYWKKRKAHYDLSTIVSIALSLLTGSKFVFGIDGEFICSSLVAAALERTSIIFPQSASHLMPADLAKHFKVDPATGNPDGAAAKHPAGVKPNI